jgi:adenylate kinase
MIFIMSEILLITGPAGAGKTTACKAFAKGAKGVWAFISQDDIRMFVKAGFKNPSKDWDEKTKVQWDVSITICSDMAIRYKENNINCIIDCFASPDVSFGKWEQALKNMRYKVIVLLPGVEETIKRNNQRTGDAKVKLSQVKEYHEWHSRWEEDKRVTLIDTTTLSVSDVVKKIGEMTKF